MVGTDVLKPPGYYIVIALYVIFLFLIVIAISSYRSSIVKREPKFAIPRVSICINECVIKVKNGHLEVNRRNLDTLLEIAKISKLYLIAQLPDQITDDQLIQVIHKEGSNILKHRIMTCSTNKGRGSMVRQLQPVLHVEIDKEIVEYLSGKIANVMFLEESNDNYSLANLLEIVPLCKN